MVRNNSSATLSILVVFVIIAFILTFMAFGRCSYPDGLTEELLSLYQYIHPDTGSLDHSLRIASV